MAAWGVVFTKRVRPQPAAQEEDMKQKLFMAAGMVGCLLVATLLFAGSLAAPQLDVPKDKAKNQVLTTVLKWAPVAGAKGYRVFVTGNLETLKNLPPKEACKDCFVDEKTEAPTYQIPPKRLKKDITYYWTVRAFNDTEEGPSAEIRSYTMASTFFMDMD